MYNEASSTSSAKPCNTKLLIIVRRTQVDNPGHTHIDQARSTFQRSTARCPSIQRITNEYPGVIKTYDNSEARYSAAGSPLTHRLPRSPRNYDLPS